MDHNLETALLFPAIPIANNRAASYYHLPQQPALASFLHLPLGYHLFQKFTGSEVTLG